MGSNIRIPTAVLMKQQGGQIENDLLQQLVERQQAAALLAGQVPSDQGALPAGTGPAASEGFSAPGQTAAPITPEEAQEVSFIDLLLSLFQEKQQGGEVSNDQLQELIRQRQAAALIGGQAPAVQQVPQGTGPAASPSFGAPGQTSAPVTTDEAQDTGFLDFLLSLITPTPEPAPAPAPPSFNMEEILNAAAEKKQTGGFVGNVINQLGNVRADTGNLDAAATGLQQFNPFAGGLGSTASNSLSSLLGSGNPVDTSPLTQAAINQGQQQFRDLRGGINEQFGALGLGSSSARQAQLNQAAGDVATNIGNTGLQAGVAAAENAASRQLGALNPFLASSEQGLRGRQSAGNLFGTSAGLDLNAQTAPLGPASSLAANLTNNLQRGLQFPGGEGNQLSTTPVTPKIGALGRGTPRFQSKFQSGGSVSPGKAGSPVGTFIRGGARGGGVDFADHLGELLFGKKFTRPPAPTQPIINIPSFQQPSLGSIPKGLSPESQLKNQLILQNKFEQESLANKVNAQDRDRKNQLSNLVQSRLNPETLGRAGQLAVGGPQRTAMDNLRLGQLAQFFGPNNVAANTRSAGANLAANLANQGARAQTGGAIQAGGGVSGVVQGPAVPPDQVPILAQGGEGVITVQLMDKLRQASDDPNKLAAVAREIQQLMAKDAGNEAQAGGTIFNRSALGAPALQRPQLPTGNANQNVIDSLNNIQGPPAPSVSFTGQASDPISIQSQLEEANRRLRLFQDLETQSPVGSRIGSGEFTQRAQQSVDQLQQQLVEEQAARAQQATQDRVAEGILAGANQPPPAVTNPNLARAREILDASRDKDSGALDIDVARQSIEAEGLRESIPNLFENPSIVGQGQIDEEINTFEQNVGLPIAEIEQALASGEIPNEPGFFESIINSEPSQFEAVVKALSERAANGDGAALEIVNRIIAAQSRAS